MKAKIYAFLLSKSGWLVKGPIVAGLGWVALQAAKYNITFTPDEQAAAATFLVAAITGLAEGLLRRVEDKNKAIVQKELGLPAESVDSYIGPVTVQAAKSSVQPADLAPALKTDVKQDVAKRKAKAGLKHQNRP